MPAHGKNFHAPNLYGKEQHVYGKIVLRFIPINTMNTEMKRSRQKNKADKTPIFQVLYVKMNHK